MSAVRERLEELAQRPRILKYRALSDCRRVRGSATVLQPVLFAGDGSVVLGERVVFGWPRSTSFYTGYCHLEACTHDSAIEIGDGTEINNNAFIKSEGPGIQIGARALLGSQVTIYDSDFHDLRAGRRRDGRPRMAAVELGEDVFIGDRVLILKGVTVGAHAVIGAGSVVSSSIPEATIAAGNPARVIGELPDADAGQQPSGAARLFRVA